jgi:phosphoglycolate phosphatase-like HAD superfamily hydrolase
MYIPLFDIDGTLLQGSGGNQAHLMGFNYAFKSVFGLENASVKQIVTDGKIDKQIILEVVEVNRVDHKLALGKLDEAINAVISYYLEHADEGSCVAVKGAESLLNDLKVREIPLGLLTGNIEAIAMDKLKRAGLDHFFQFGAFGNLALKRVDLIQIARKRATKIFGTNIVTASFVIVGDSILDVLCAKDGNLPVIGVSTGNYSIKQLVEAGADLVVAGLEHKTEIIKFIEGYNYLN